MAEHRGSRSLPKTIGVMVAAAIGVLLAIGGPVTGAYWTGQAVVDGGAVTSGSLDIALRPSNQGGTFAGSITIPEAALSDMLPGDTRAFTMAVRSDGLEAPLTYQLLGQSTATSNVLGNNLQTQIYLSTQPASNPGGAALGYRTDQFGSAYGASCSGTQIGPLTSLSTTGSVLLTPTGSGVVAPGEISNLCVRVTLPTWIQNGVMNHSASITLTVVARSVER